MKPVSTTKLYNSVSSTFGRENAENLSSYIDEKVEINFKENMSMFPTKSDLVESLTSFKTDIKGELASFKTEITNSTNAVLTSFKTEIRADLAESFNSFRTEIVGLMKVGFAEGKANLAETKAKIMRWMFIFWTGQAAVTLGYILVLFKIRG